ncbi:hypothetical protein ACWDR0_01460 [Streptomyces sp. NPDC003691]
MADTAHRHRVLRIGGTLLGTALAVAVLPGLDIRQHGIVFLSVLLPGLWLAILNQFIHVYPSSLRGAPPGAVLALGLVGIVQEILQLWLIIWIGEQMGIGLTADSWRDVVLGGIIIRVATLLALVPVPRAATA